MHAGQLKASLPCAISPICSGWKRTKPHLPRPTKSTLSASDDAWRCQAPASCQSLDQQACATARSRSSRCMALSYLLLLVPKCVPWPTPVHTYRAAVGAARALLQVFRSVLLLCAAHQIVAFDFGFSDRSFSATLCEKDNPERKPPCSARRDYRSPRAASSCGFQGIDQRPGSREPCREVIECARTDPDCLTSAIDA